MGRVIAAEWICDMEAYRIFDVSKKGFTIGYAHDLGLVKDWCECKGYYWCGVIG